MTEAMALAMRMIVSTYLRGGKDHRLQSEPNRLDDGHDEARIAAAEAKRARKAAARTHPRIIRANAPTNHRQGDPT